MSNHKVTSYLVLTPSEKRWITREEAIYLAENRLFRAVVVHNKKHTYLRPFPHETPYRDLAGMSGYGWEFEQNVFIEGVLRRAERTIIKTPNGNQKTKVERSIVLITDRLSVA